MLTEYDMLCAPCARYQQVMMIETTPKALSMHIKLPAHACRKTCMPVKIAPAYRRPSCAGKKRYTKLTAAYMKEAESPPRPTMVDIAVKTVF